MQDYWLKQKQNEPLFPDILWARPESKHAAGKLLIIGGNTHSFIDVGLSYQAAVQAGAGTVRVLLPDSLRKTIGATLENCEYAPSTPSGSFARSALNELLINASWADCVLLAGDFGRNSETAILLESFVTKYSGLLVLTRDAVDYFTNQPKLILDRTNTCIVGALGQVQKIAIASHFPQAITTNLDLLRLVSVLRDFTHLHSAHIITHQLGTTCIATYERKVSTTPTGNGDDRWRTPTAAKAAVYWMQTPNRPLEAFTTSLVTAT